MMVSADLDLQELKFGQRLVKSGCVIMSCLPLSIKGEFLKSFEQEVSLGM